MKWFTAIIVAVIAAASGAHASEASVRLKRLPGDAYELQGEFIVAASSRAVWDVLTDYEGIPSYVTSMRSCRVLETRADGSLLVEQRAVGGMFFLKRAVTIVLEVRREEGALTFEDVGRESFWRYEGGWRAEAAPDGVKVTYHLIAQPDFPAPSMVMSRVMKKGAKRLLSEVRTEILRRSELERTLR